MTKKNDETQDPLQPAENGAPTPADKKPIPQPRRPGVLPFAGPAPAPTYATPRQRAAPAPAPKPAPAAAPTPPRSRLANLMGAKAKKPVDLPDERPEPKDRPESKCKWFWYKGVRIPIGPDEIDDEIERGLIKPEVRENRGDVVTIETDTSGFMADIVVEQARRTRESRFIEKMIAGLAERDKARAEAGVSDAQLAAPAIRPVDHPRAAPGFRTQYFWELAQRVYDNGWMPISQGHESRNRGPVQKGWEVDKVEYSKWTLTRVPQSILDGWIEHLGNGNLALLMSTSSQRVLTLDIDVIDPDLVDKICKLAEKRLGYTPLRRIGRAPRIALIYRQKADEEQPIKSKAYVFAPMEGDAEKMAVEIISSGTPLTAFGTHHKTGKEFLWPDKNPLDVGPEAAREITREQLNGFIDEVHRTIRRFKGLGTGSQGGTPPDLVTDFIALPSGINAPQMPHGDVPWRLEEGGLVVDGREKWIFAYSGAICRANPKFCRTAEGIEQLAAYAQKAALMRLELSGRWDAQAVRDGMHDRVVRTAPKVARAADKIEAQQPLDQGDLPPFGKLVKIGGIMTRPVTREMPRVRPANGALDWIGAGQREAGITAWERHRSGVRSLGKAELVEDARKQRALITDRNAIAAEISRKVDDAADAVLRDVMMRTAAVHVIPAPTGSGKSTRVQEAVFRWLVSNPRHFADEDRGPVIYVLPSYQNILEQAAKALALEGVEVSFQSEGDHVEFARAHGVKAMLFKGMVRAGCKRSEARTLLNAAGIGAGDLCYSKRKKTQPGGEEVEVEEFCPFRTDENGNLCPALAMKEAAKHADILYVPHAFLTAPWLSSVLKTARLVIADESMTFQVLQTRFVPLNSLRLSRKETWLTKKEKESKVTAEGLADDRDLAVEIVEKAWAEKACPAQRLFEHPHGARLVASALTVCGRAQDVVREVHAQMSDGEVKRLVESPRGTDLLLERKFWSLVEERMEALAFDRAHEGISTVDGKPWPKRALGDRDYRFQPITLDWAQTHVSDTADEIVTTTVNGPTPGWRMSWRRTLNWSGATWVLLDASADESIVRKLFRMDAHRDKGEEAAPRLVYTPIDAPLNLRTVAIADRTYSTSSLVASEQAPENKRAEADELLARVRQGLSMVAAAHGHGRVVVGSTKKVRQRMFADWWKPENVGHGHFGAFRGLNFAEKYLAAVCVGRTEMPIWIVDGYAAALSYDDETPEQPYNLRGDGKTVVDGKETDLRRQGEARTIALRSGHDAKIMVPEVTGRWGRLVDRQWRDEETRQFIGRLRPVFREDTPTCVMLTSCIPEGIVVDEMLSLDDLLAGDMGEAWEAVRLAAGVIDPEITPAAAPHFDQAKIRDAMVRLLALGDKLPGFRPVTWMDSFDVEHTSLIASWYVTEEATEDAFRTGWAAARFSPDHLLDVKAGTPHRALVIAPARKEDLLESSFGGNDMIRKREEDRHYALRLTQASGLAT